MTRNRASNGNRQGRPTALQVAVDLLDFGLEAPLDAAGLEAAKRLAERLSGEALDGLLAQGVTGGVAEVRLGLRYDGADAVLAAAPGPKAEVRAAFEAAHRRLFGFVEPDSPLLIARVEVEAAEPLASTAPPPLKAPAGDAAPTPAATPTVMRRCSCPWS
jgi:5-oxoprolinase (ATP-hydrolysing)